MASRRLTEKQIQELLNASDEEDNISTLSDSEENLIGEDLEDLENSEDSDEDYVPEEENDSHLSNTNADEDTGRQSASASVRRQARANIRTQSKSSDEDQESGEKNLLSLELPGDRLIVVPSKRSLRGKDGHRWSALPPQKTNRGRPLGRNLIRGVAGPVGDATKAADMPLSAFQVFLSDEIVDKIVLHTNEEIERKAANYGTARASEEPTNRIELKALFGLFILTAALKDGHLSVDEMFDANMSGSSYKATMSKERFRFLIDCLRFDAKETRNSRKQNDPFAAIREVWEDVIKNCQGSFKPGANTTIDEQLLGFRGRCPFRMYIPSKPNKYGIKL